METVTVSREYEVIIPESIRDRMNLQPGQQIQMFLHENRIELIPVQSARELRGFLEGIDTNVSR